MPELPEVEQARRELARAATGRTITRIRVLHRAQAKHLPPARARRAEGRRIEAVERHGKHQLLRLSGGWTILAHFRMTGDWAIGEGGTEIPPQARVVVDLDDDTRFALIDPRALSTFTVHEPGSVPLPVLGPDPLSAAFNGEWLGQALRSRGIAIKVALLDQRVAAGVGNIYASEALWDARISPRSPAAQLRRDRLARLAGSIRRVLHFAAGDRRHAYGARDGFAVYDREGDPCTRCGARIRRITQAARSTYFCPRCQRR